MSSSSSFNSDVVTSLPRQDLSITAYSDIVRMLDEQSRIQTLALQKLHAKRNALLPISYLPSEILVNIFELLMSRERSDKTLSCYHDCCRSNKWIRVTWVYQRWRRIALDCPTLWRNHVTYKRRDQILAFLERSRNSSLNVHHHPGIFFRNCPPNLPLVLSHMHRIYDLTLHTDLMESGELSPLLKDLADKPAPRLEILSLREQRHPSSFDSMFGGEWPKLKSLCLLHIHFPWDAPIFSGLKKLSLTEIFPQFTMVQWSNILRNCPELECLTLYNCGPDSTDTTLPEPVPLHHLRSFDFRNSSADACNKIIKSIALPPTVSWIIECANAPMLHRPELVIPEEKEFTAKLLNISLRPGSNLVLVEAESRLEFDQAENSIKRKFELTYTDAVSKADGFTVLNTLLTRCHMQDATKLSLTAAIWTEHMSKDAWNKVFLVLPHIEHLTLDMNEGYRKSVAEEGFAEALMTPVEINSENAYPLPKLCFLHIQYVNFTTDRTVFPQKFAECLQRRSNSGLRLHLLKITNAIGVDEEQINLFRDWVDELDWDGILWVNQEYEQPWDQDDEDGEEQQIPVEEEPEM